MLTPHLLRALAGREQGEKGEEKHPAHTRNDARFEARTEVRGKDGGPEGSRRPVRFPRASA